MLNQASSVGGTTAHLAKLFCGNRDAVASLGSMTDSGRLPHAFIIEGADGLGKSTFARLIAQCAMCRCEEPLSGECSHCRKLREQIHPDLIYIAGSGKTNAIAIDAVRAMRKDSQTAPNEAQKRVFVLEDCDNMQPPAQNAFLKIFEEAPSHVIFIMTCRSAMNLLTTIRSRGRIITLHPVDVEEGAVYIARTHPSIGIEQARALCQKSGGNIGEALRLAESESGDTVSDQADTIADAVLHAMCIGSEWELAAACAKIGRDRNLGGVVCARLSESIRQALIVSVGAQDTLSAPKPSIPELSRTRSSTVLMNCLDALSDLADSLKNNISMPLFYTKLAIILQRRS